MVKLAAGIMGIIGGAWTLVVSWGAIVVGMFLKAFLDYPYLMSIGGITILLSIVGIVGGFLTFAKPGIGGFLMLVGSVGAIMLTVVFAIHGQATVHTILPMILLIVGGVLALTKARARK
jgi:hypothetical protein